jgi:uncharacterized RDD family membrane protein YckC
MQCPACRVVYSNGLELCPRCKTPAAKVPEPEPRRIEASIAPPVASSPLPQVQANAAEQSADSKANVGDSSIAASVQKETKAASANTKTAASTLIEFPGASRASRPQWRKDLTERVREIQERRAREATHENQYAAHESLQSFAETPRPSQNPQTTTSANLSPDAPEKLPSTLGLVPSSTDNAPVNPLVVAALRRIERARQSVPSSNTQTRTRSSMSSAATATAVARVQEEHYQTEAELHASASVQLPEPTLLPPVAQPIESGQAAAVAETVARAHNLVVVPAHSITEEKENTTATTTTTLPRRIVTQVVEDALLTRQDAQQVEALHHEAFDQERASVQARLMSGLADVLVVAFASTPFAAIIELTNGNWTDLRVVASMSGIVLLVMFLYLTASTALAGRTWGMSLVSLRAVDAHTGVLPTTKQALIRAFAYMLSLAACGLGLFYALFDAEGRTAYDHLSGTIVVRD